VQGKTIYLTVTGNEKNKRNVRGGGENIRSNENKDH